MGEDISECQLLFRDTEQMKNLKSKGEEGVKKDMDIEHLTKVRGNRVK